MSRGRKAQQDREDAATPGAVTPKGNVGATEERGAQMTGLEWVDLRTLSPWVGNPRKLAGAVPIVDALLCRFGFGAPLQAWGREGERRILAGHARREGYQRAMGRDPAWLCRGTPGPWLVPVRWMDHLSTEEARELLLADNKASELASWDARLLKELAAEVDLASLGWTEGEVADLAKEAAEKAGLAWDNAQRELGGPLLGKRVVVTLLIAVTVADAADIEAAITRARGGTLERGAALAAICRQWASR